MDTDHCGVFVCFNNVQSTVKVISGRSKWTRIMVFVFLTSSQPRRSYQGGQSGHRSPSPSLPGEARTAPKPGRVLSAQACCLSGSVRQSTRIIVGFLLWSSQPRRSYHGAQSKMDKTGCFRSDVSPKVASRAFSFPFLSQLGYYCGRRN